MIYEKVGGNIHRGLLQQIREIRHATEYLTSREAQIGQTGLSKVGGIPLE